MIRPPPVALVEKASGIDLEDLLPELVSLQATGETVEAFCLAYRRLAICKLLQAGTGEELFGDLSRAARAYLHFVESPRGRAHPASRARPFFDAIAAGDVEAAERIARAVPAQHTVGEEYEDDFLALHFWLQMVGRGGTQAEGVDLVDRLERAVPDADDLRLALCRAWLTRDDSAWVEAIDTFERTARLNARRELEAETLNPDDAQSTAKISVELLALLRFGELRGLSSRTEYPLAPGVARKTGAARLPGSDAWKQVVSYYELA